MANKIVQPDTQQHNAPDFIAWHVIDKGQKSFWNKAGAAWRHKDAKGFTLQLEVVPIHGRIVLRQPLEDVEGQPEKKEGRS